jgi:hypothetical protein
MKIINAYFADLHLVGDAYYQDSEEGPQIVNPPHQPCIIAECADGRRFMLNHQFKANEWEFAETIARKIKKAGKINPDNWHYYYPTYGSNAHQEETDMAMGYVRAGREKELAGHVLGGLV